MVSEEADRASILLSVQRALLGAVSPSILGICADWGHGKIVMFVFVQNSLLDDEFEDLNGAATQVMADFSWASVEVRIIDKTQPPLTGWSGVWVFLRRGVRVSQQ